MTKKEFEDGFVNIYSDRLSLAQQSIKMEISDTNKDKTISLTPDKMLEIMHHSFVVGWSIGLALETIDNDTVKFVAATEFLKLYTKQMSQVLPIKIIDHL